MTVIDRLREFDRKAGFGSQTTEDQWRRTAKRWPWLLLAAALQMLSIVVMGLLNAPAGVAASWLGFVALGLAFQAGRLKAEDDRLQGRDGVIGGQRRPSGL